MGRQGNWRRHTQEQENDRSEDCDMRKERSALRARRTQRSVELQKMNWRAVGGRRIEMRGKKKLREVFAHAVKPGIAG
jgi:hypothetical protein